MKKILFLLLLCFPLLGFSKEYKVSKNGYDYTLEIVNIEDIIYLDITLPYNANKTFYFVTENWELAYDDYVSLTCDTISNIGTNKYRFDISQTWKLFLYKYNYITISNTSNFLTIGKPFIKKKDIDSFRKYLLENIINIYDTKYNDLTLEYYALQIERDSLLTDKLKLTDINLVLENKVKLLTEEQNKKENEVNEENVSSTNIQKYDSEDYNGLTYNAEKKTWVGKKYSRVKEPEKVYNTSGKYKYKYKYWRNGRWNYRY